MPAENYIRISVEMTWGYVSAFIETNGNPYGELILDYIYLLPFLQIRTHLPYPAHSPDLVFAFIRKPSPGHRALS